MPSRSGVVGNMRSRRPYFPRADWLWLPIPANPSLDPDSATIVTALASGTTHTANLVNYGVTMRGPGGITTSTPRYDISFSRVPAWGPDPFGSDTMPIPDGTPLAPGTDIHVSVADPVRNRTYNLWQAIHTGSLWGASWGAPADLNGDGRESPGSSTGSGLARYGAVIRLAEIAAGKIEHALFFATDIARPTEFRYPATKTDGVNNAGVGLTSTIPEGARVQLDPTINLAAISGITPGELAVGRALQTYGAYCGDNGGSRMGFIFELADDHNPTTDHPGAVYAAAGLSEYMNMSHIPWSSLRVLQAWNGPPGAGGGGGGGGGTAPSFVAATAASSSNGGVDLVATLPAGAVSGNYQLAVISIGTTSETITTVPSGWTLVASAAGNDTDSYQVLVYESTTSTASSTWTKSGTREARVVRAAWASHGGRASFSGPSVNGTGITHDTPSVTPAQSNSRLIGVCVMDGSGTASYIPPTGWTERSDTVGDLQAITIADAVAGPSPTMGTFTSSESDEALTFALVLNPA